MGQPGTTRQVPVRQDAADDAYLFRQGPASGPGQDHVRDLAAGLGAVQHLPNVALFLEQVDAFTQLITPRPQVPNSRRTSTSC